jgi:hypothetical protein
MSADQTLLSILDMVSFATMCLALAIGAVIIIGGMIKGKRAELAAQMAESYEHV